MKGLQQVRLQLRQQYQGIRVQSSQRGAFGEGLGKGGERKGAIVDSVENLGFQNLPSLPQSNSPAKQSIR